MMDFEEAWNTLNVGDKVRIRNGRPPSGRPGSVPHNIWRSHNFTGTLEEKYTEFDWRYMRFGLPDDPTTPEVEQVAYSVAEGAGHTFVRLGPPAPGQ